MSTRTLFANLGRLAVAAACVIPTVSCGGDLLRTGRGASMLVISSMSGEGGGPNGGTATAFLQSDVQVLVEQDVNGVSRQVATFFNDNATATIQAIPKNPAAVTTAVNSITLTRYHVEFRRSDGRNVPGVDVPFSFDGGLGVTIGAGASGTVQFEIVRHQAKLESPLANLRSGGGQIFISTIAEITFYGHDQNGNEASVTGRMDVHFGDFADQ